MQSIKLVCHKDYKHDCTNPAIWPEEFPAPATSPNFIAGREYDIPEGIANKFIETGHFAEPGNMPIEKDHRVPVEIRPHDVTLGVSSQ